MPTYDYRCAACGHTFNEMQKFSDAPLVTCPKCQKDALERLFGGGGAIIFKGGGFYETDYRRAGEKPEGATDTKTETPAKAETAKPAETKTESAPAAKADK